MTDDSNHLMNKLEYFQDRALGSEDQAVRCSIAISLRRIADLLEKEEQRKQQAVTARKDRGERMVKVAT